MTVLSVVTPKGEEHEVFNSREMDLRLTNVNMIVSHRESLENQGSQARRVPEAYR